MISGCPNEFPRGVNVLDERWGDEKYHFVEHAERNTIYKAIRAGYSQRVLHSIVPFTLAPHVREQSSKQA